MRRISPLTFTACLKLVKLKLYPQKLQISKPSLQKCGGKCSLKGKNTISIKCLNHVFIFNWKTIALQCCANFCYSKMWTSHTDIYAPLLLSLPPSPHPTLLGYHRALNWTPCAIQQPPTSYLFCIVMYICQYYSTSSSHSPSPAMSTSPFSASAMKSMLNNKNFAIKNSECGCCVNQQGMFTWSLSWCCYLCTHSVAMTSLTLSHKTFVWCNTP